MGMLYDAMQWLEQQRHQYLTINVRYKRGDEFIAVAATVGNTVFEVPDSYGVMIKTESRDYLLRPSDLIISGRPILPMPGDRISENGYEYEVMAPGNKPCWRWSDSFRNTLRIHTKLVSLEGTSHGS